MASSKKRQKGFDIEGFVPEKSPQKHIYPKCLKEVYLSHFEIAVNILLCSSHIPNSKEKPTIEADSQLDNLY